MAAQDFIFLQHFKTAQQQFGEIDNAFAIALLIIGGVDIE